jgi:hypothetical protein
MQKSVKNFFSQKQHSTPKIKYFTHLKNSPPFLTFFNFLMIDFLFQRKSKNSFSFFFSPVIQTLQNCLSPYTHPPPHFQPLSKALCAFPHLEKQSPKITHKCMWRFMLCHNLKSYRLKPEKSPRILFSTVTSTCVRRI